MPSDTQIYSGAVEDGNSDYLLPSNAEITVLTVAATFTDNGAGADWCPAVEMISDSGHTIARALLPDVKVTAGDDAEVSWFPGVKPGAAAVATVAALPTAVLRRFGTHTLAAGASYPIPFDEFQTTDASMFSWSLFAPSNVILPQPGLYQWWLSLYPDLGSDWPAAGAGNIHFSASVTASGPTDNAERRVFAQYPFVTYETGVAANDGTLVTTMGVKNIQNHGNAGASVVNNTAAPWTLGVGTFLYLVRLGDAVTF